uniref:Pathogenesis-related protein 1 n=1 Tax=Moniliophthora perniciosa TaxID=153609 RepID=A0A8E6Y837_MONPR|nr:pathogenesis-related protein 1 [Moniliophthora perniciosa]QVT77617.1 pathogenesis-related protein 1 [Moniliophthora perniciosa]QVT77618.1 pathogenesis-related protein 1 [Moniliophthora perniciosa]
MYVRILQLVFILAILSQSIASPIPEKPKDAKAAGYKIIPSSSWLYVHNSKRQKAKVPALKWNSHLMKQAQSVVNTCGASASTNAVGNDRTIYKVLPQTIGLQGDFNAMIKAWIPDDPYTLAMAADVTQVGCASANCNQAGIVLACSYN